MSNQSSSSSPPCSDPPSPLIDGDLIEFEQWLLRIMLSSGIPQLEQLLSLVEKSRDLVLNAIQFKSVLHPPKEAVSPQIQSQNYGIPRESVSMTEVNIDLRPPLQPASFRMEPTLEIMTVPNKTPEFTEVQKVSNPNSNSTPEKPAAVIIPPAINYTVTDLQFGAAAPRFMERELPRMNISIPTMTSTTGYMNLIGIVEDIELNVFKNKNGKGMGIRGDLMIWGLEGNLHEMKLWTQTFAHLLGLPLEDVYSKSKNLDLLRVKFLSLYRGRLLCMNGNFRMYENNAYFNIDEAAAVPWQKFADYFEQGSGQPGEQFPSEPSDRSESQTHTEEHNLDNKDHLTPKSE